MVRVERFTGGPVGTHGYLVWDEGARTAIQVDAPYDVAPGVLAALARESLTLIALVDTHGHWDHIGDSEALRRATGAPLLIHSADASLLAAPHAYGYPLPRPIAPHRADRFLAEAEALTVGSAEFRVLHTPGHTPGGICLYAAGADLLLSGDTLFDGSYGRTDLPGASERDMWESLIRLSALPPATRVCPGHGDETTIGAQAWLTGLARAAGEAR